MIYIKGTDKNDFIEFNDQYDSIILSPSFCWYKILDIPTNNINKAKKIADHMLSDRIEKYTNVSLKKDDNKFKVYCYNKQEIEYIIKKINRPKCKLYFAYEITDNLNYIINDDKFIEYLKSQKNITTKPILNLNLDSSNTTTKLIVLNILLFFSIIVYSLNQYSEIYSIKELENSILKGNKTNYEINSLIKSYKKKQAKSKNMKISLEKILKNNKDLSSIIYYKGKFSIKKGEKIVN